ncbi:hypothetical protein M5K25_001775 [Dendrobium thyrsiflorum]|uniref:Uncharacterized protein n=1 Tax=Dendrobium thyrsiflorum TaxID=117978 RepID=A0ABD0VSS9_DENTH
MDTELISGLSLEESQFFCLEAFKAMKYNIAKKSQALPLIFFLFLLYLLSVHSMELDKVSELWFFNRRLKSTSSNDQQAGKLNPTKKNNSFGHEFEVSKHEVPSGPNPDSNR